MFGGTGGVRLRYAVGLLSLVGRVRHGGGINSEPSELRMTLKRMDNVLIVVDDLEAAKAFFIELGLKLEGETTVEGPAVGSLIGLKNVRATLAMMRTPDGQGIELDKFHTPDAIRFGPVDAPVNTLGIRRVMFAVDDIDALVARMRAQGAELIGEMQYGDTYRLAYIRGPEGVIVALAEQRA
jgi:catechol 2,3-dioxygenase-like lactoylglutathione lyase family enzyme